MPRDNCDFMGNDNCDFNSQHRGNHSYRSGARGMLLRIVDHFVRQRAFLRRLIFGHHYPAPFVILDVLWATGKLLLRTISFSIQLTVFLQILNTTTTGGIVTAGAWSIPVNLPGLTLVLLPLLWL